jgi:endonuclease/exonuclease/phosphatase family metal-dependent hydrolase
MRKTLLALPVAALMLASVATTTPAHAATPRAPLSITSVTAAPGPKVGEITLKWSQDGKYTTGYVLETALTSFSKTNPEMAKTGRRTRLLNIPKNLRTITLSAAQVHSAGAGVASGNHLYFRFYAVNTNAGGTTTRAYPYLQAMTPKPLPPQASGTKMRIASFNVRTAKATTDPRTWIQRAPDVAAQIVDRNPGLAALQELGPGRADGLTGTTNGTARQTESLITALQAANGTKYALVRTTPYVQAGLPSGTQGTRILYDTSRYTLQSDCPDTTDGRKYSPSCSIVLPLLPTDAETARRRAAVAQFQDRVTKKSFFFVSAHLDERHSDNLTTERSYDSLRKSQANAIVEGVAKLNTANLPVIIGGDMNSWQNNRVGNSPHDTLVAQGFYDASAAVTRVNIKYTTMNHFNTTLPASSQGFGSRLDMLFVKGAKGSARFENVMKVTDPARPSDHNMVVSDIVLGG